jgi:DNA repair protein RadA/Sms
VTHQTDRIKFVCEECGDDFSRWEGRCPNCESWNSLKEFHIPSNRVSAKTSWLNNQWNKPTELNEINVNQMPRISLGLSEVNRVLGGGIVPGSVILLAGDPGVGKSTLLLQITNAAFNAKQRVFYISGEESAHQVQIRAQRLGISGRNILFLPETSAESILENLEKANPHLVIIDSIQTLFSDSVQSSTGSITQVRECTRMLLQWAKLRQVPIFLAGHVTKDGSVAGPRVLEHMVDVVLYLEGERISSLRLLRCEKNRFGSTQEVGVFEMHSSGLIEVQEPSSILLKERLENVSGSAITCTLEGTRPLALEVQALVTPSTFPSPRRLANGITFNRLLLVTAVLSKNSRLPLGTQDIVLNIAGGLRIEEPAADLSLALAIASSYRDMPIAPSLVSIGEVGLSGEIRRIPQIQRRVAEASRLGFQKVIVPSSQFEEIQKLGAIEVLPASDLRTALHQAIGH